MVTSSSAAGRVRRARSVDFGFPVASLTAKGTISICGEAASVLPIPSSGSYYFPRQPAAARWGSPRRMCLIYFPHGFLSWTRRNTMVQSWWFTGGHDQGMMLGVQEECELKECNPRTNSAAASFLTAFAAAVQNIVAAASSTAATDAAAGGAAAWGRPRSAAAAQKSGVTPDGEGRNAAGAGAVAGAVVSCHRCPPTLWLWIHSTVRIGVADPPAVRALP
eukprot:gene16726-biopygen7612